jgi:DNA-binding LytR/AlgR family response regulator
MIKVVIIEDEIPARKKLKRFLEEVDHSTEVIAEIGTVSQAIEFLKNENAIDLILSDIELQDGNAFEIYEEVTVLCPIIFTTAYNQFLMDAFESNGIEYLLKPFSLERFQKAWDKFLLLKKSPLTDDNLLSKLTQLLNNPTEKTFKNRFSVSSKQGTYFLETNDIVYFSAEEGVVFAIDKNFKKHLLTQTTLKAIEVLVNPAIFFRINRSEMINKNYVERIERYTKNTLSIKIQNYQKQLFTSQSHTASFREWIEK